MTIDNVGSIATFIIQTLANVPAGISGNMIDIVDSARQYVENYTGIIISAGAIAPKYQGAIVDFSKADTVNLVNLSTGDNIKLADLSIDNSGDTSISAAQYKAMGEMKLRAIGRKIRFARSIS